MNNYYKHIIVVILLASIAYNFDKLLYFTSAFGLIYDTTATTKIINNSSADIQYFYIPLEEDIQYFYNGLFYRLATGNLKIKQAESIIYAHDIKNVLLAKDNQGNYSSTNLDSSNWGKEKKSSEFISHSKINPYKSDIDKLRNKFGIKVLISFLILCMTILCVKFSFYIRNRFIRFTIATMLVILSAIHSFFIAKEFIFLYFVFVY